VRSLQELGQSGRGEGSLKIRFSRKLILNFSGSNAEQFPEKDIFRVDGRVVRVYDP
jgi:hypothetical protein